MIVAFLVALALAAPAAAQPPIEDWQGWTWSSVVERLTGWAGEALSVFGASETGTSDLTGGDESPAPAEDPSPVLLDGGTHSESWPEIDPNG